MPPPPVNGGNVGGKEDTRAIGVDNQETDTMHGVEYEINDMNANGDQANDDPMQEINSAANELDEHRPVPKNPATFKTRWRPPPPIPGRLYTRGLPQTIIRSGKESRRLQWFGPSAADYGPVFETNEKWGHERTLPSRKVDAYGHGGFKKRQMSSDEQAESWKWYLEAGGRYTIAARQSILEITSQQAEDFILTTLASNRQCLMGPFNDPKPFDISPGQSIPLRDAWQPNKPANYRNGFLLNLGGKVNCLEWHPDQTGQRQYLASTILPDCTMEYPKFEHPTAPAFTPRAPHEASVQIWEMSTSNESFIDVNARLQLKMVLCTKWGDVKALKWCPTSFGQSGSLCLLAGVWSDGAVRIIDVPGVTSDSGPQYLYIQKAAFESRPPNTVSTSLTWLSSSEIAVGCANGCMAIWDISQCLQSGSNNPRPRIYSSVTTSYILSIQSCTPSRPDMVTISSMAGHIALVDISRLEQGPIAAVSYSQRMRTGPGKQVWHDLGQACFHIDDHFHLRGFLMRRMFNSISVGKAKSPGTAIATSACHPFILVGSTNGDVMAINPIPRMIDGKAEIWQQTWFAHEWRRPTEEEVAGGPGGSDAGRVGPGGISRITEGFKLEKLTLGSDDDGQNRLKEGNTGASVYEEQTAITVLAWNPNVHVAGWAAAGMADGLVRIEDIAA